MTETTTPPQTPSRQNPSDELGEAPSRPRLTPQGHASGEASGEDATDPQGGAKQGQGDKAEG